MTDIGCKLSMISETATVAFIINKDVFTEAKNCEAVTLFSSQGCCIMSYIIQ